MYSVTTNLIRLVHTELIEYRLTLSVMQLYKAREKSKEALFLRFFCAVKGISPEVNVFGLWLRSPYSRLVFHRATLNRDLTPFYSPGHDYKLSIFHTGIQAWM